MEKGNVTSYLIGGRRKLFYKYPDGSEMVEEYDKKSHEIISRRFKKKGKLSDSEKIEIGEKKIKNENLSISLSNNNPIFLRKDNKIFFQFRIRNLIGYNKKMFFFDIDNEKQMIILRTTNKKYFKKFSIGDLLRNKINIDKKNLSFEFNNNTLLISYKKPIFILEKEKKLRLELEKLNKQNFQEGDLECTTQ